MMAHVHTLTGNLLWERTLGFAAWSPGRTQRAQSDFFQCGGKGINVSKMLVRLGAPTSALLFPGGDTGAQCEQWVRAHNIPARAFPMTAATRIGVVVRAPGQPETTFLSPDVPIEPAAAAACAKYLDACPAGDVLAVCGSIPGWASDGCEPLRAAIDRWLGRGPVVVDTYGPPLAWLVTRPLAWVKINRAELDALTGGRDSGDAMAPRLAALIDRLPVLAWIVTDGPRAVWYAARGGTPASAEPPRVAEISATGSGDVLHACLIHGIINHGMPLSAAVLRALPYAAANAAHPTAIDFPLNNLPGFGSIP